MTRRPRLPKGEKRKSRTNICNKLTCRGARRNIYFGRTDPFDGAAVWSPLYVPYVPYQSRHGTNEYKWIKAQEIP